SSAGMTSYFFDFKRLGDYWFARFQWINTDLHGFSFLKYETKDILAGAWWFDEEFEKTPDAPVEGTGNATRWVRQYATDFPKWASEFFDHIRKGGSRPIAEKPPRWLRRWVAGRR